MEILRHIFLLFFSSYVIWKVCDSFQQASRFLGRHMPNGTRGATINAIGSSFPEFMTSFIAIFEYSKNDGAMFGISNTTGSVVYNITMIPFFVIFSCFLFKTLNKLKFDKVILIRDSIFLIMTQVYLMLVLSSGVINIVNSLILIAFYILYLIIIFNYPKKIKNTEKIHYDFLLENSKHIIKALKDVDLFRIFFSKSQKQNTLNSFIVLSLSIIVFYFMCDILVSSSYAISDILHIPSYFVAMTVTALATSVPDTILSIKDAKVGEFDDAITNAFGSNIFNISFCIGFPILIYNIIYKSDLFLGYNSVESINNLKNISIFLVILVVATFIIGKSKWIFRSFILLLTYILFLVYVGLEIDNFQTIPNDTMQHHRHLANFSS
ncbi:MAG: sodium:calcium antiporter [Alphaproteobacteria bacterium]|nr:sodium:calcium antiporter [Alphaproteobacteria bacterium]